MKEQLSNHPTEKKMSRMAMALIGSAVVLLLAVTIMALYLGGTMDPAGKESKAPDNTQSGEGINQTDSESAAEGKQTSEGQGSSAGQDSSTEESSTGATERRPSQTREPVMLPHLEKLYAQNPDLVGWIEIADTVIDYPVMYTPWNGEKYIYADFEGKFNVAGLPFIEDDCSMDPESDNLIIYGHNMKNGSMFASLMKYQKEKYWEEHPIIRFSTLYEEREYEIVAAFYDRVYYKHEDCFKFYQFIDARDEAHFEEAMTYYSENALYDTGVTAKYGDRLITLVTCAYHIKNGRFVVVAREKVE